VVDGDVVVVLRDGEAVATGLDGTVRWRAGSGAEELAAGDGYVALLGPTTVRVVHSGDGATVASLPRSALFAQGPTLLGVVDGSVGIALGGSPQSSTQLGSTTWLDLGDGEQDPIDELFASSREEPPRTAMVNWLFHGTTSPVDDGDVTVGGVPVVTSSDGRSSLRVRDAEGELRSVTLPTPDPTGPVADLGEVTGAAPGRLAVTQYRFSDENDHDVVTHLLDIEDGSRRTITGWAGMLLTDRFLLAAEQGPGVEEPRVAVFDPATGEQRWVASRPELFGRPRHDASLLVAADVLGATTLLLDDGTVPWRHVGSSVLADLRPVLGARRVLLATAGGEVVALDRADGGELWRTDVGAPITAITGAGQDTLVGTREGLVVHLGADGRERQRIAVATSPVVDVAALGTTTVAVTDDAVIGLRVDGDGLVTDDEVDLP
jgi:hypothetical protein